MLEQIRRKLEDEQTQRAILHAGGLVATFVATRVFASLMDKGIGSGIDMLMNKLHPTIETPAE